MTDNWDASGTAGDKRPADKTALEYDPQLPSFNGAHITVPVQKKTICNSQTEF